MFHFTQLPLEATAAHASILAWRIPRTEEPGGLVREGAEADTTEATERTATHLKHFNTRPASETTSETPDTLTVLSPGRPRLATSAPTPLSRDAAPGAGGRRGRRGPSSCGRWPRRLPRGTDSYLPPRPTCSSASQSASLTNSQHLSSSHATL